MMHGDLSNKVAPALGVRFEDVIRESDGSLNKSCKAFLEHTTRLVDVNIYVLTTGDRRRALAFLTKWAVPYSTVVEIDSTLEIPDVVKELDFVAYYDLDRHIVENINVQGRPRVGVLWTSQPAL